MRYEEKFETSNEKLLLRNFIETKSWEEMEFYVDYLNEFEKELNKDGGKYHKKTPNDSTNRTFKVYEKKIRPNETLFRAVSNDMKTITLRIDIEPFTRENEIERVEIDKSGSPLRKGEKENTLTPVEISEIPKYIVGCKCEASFEIRYPSASGDIKNLLDLKSSSGCEEYKNLNYGRDYKWEDIKQDNNYGGYLEMHRFVEDVKKKVRIALAVSHYDRCPKATSRFL